MSPKENTEILAINFKQIAEKPFYLSSTDPITRISYS
jgi:hypothetical protein